MLPGVDEPPYQLEPYKPGDKFVIGHFGSLSETRNLASTIAALDLLLDQQPGLDGVVELHVYGGPLDPVSASAVAQARHRCVRHFGRIEADPVTGKSGREQILQRMRSADVLLLLHGVEPICAEYIPSKMYEYLWMQRPILGLVHSNPQLKNLLQTGGHLVFDTSEIDAQSLDSALLQGLKTLLTQWAGHGIADVAHSNALTTKNAVTQLLGFALSTEN
jgi:glycosyltransferase involved in cell wall biosynthesis